MANEIIIPGPEAKQLPVQFQSDCDGDGFSISDLIIPRWKIVQATSRTESAKPGFFFNSLTCENAAKLEKIVFLIRKKSRVLFPKEDYSGTRLCWSKDAVVPAVSEMGQLKPISSTCLNCEKSAWKTEKSNEGQKLLVPPCHETTTFIGVDSSMSPFVISFWGSASSYVKNFLSLIFIKKRLAQRALRDFKLDLGLKVHVSQKGKCYVPTFENISEIKESEIKSTLNNYYAALKDSIYHEQESD